MQARTRALLLAHLPRVLGDLTLEFHFYLAARLVAREARWRDCELVDDHTLLVLTREGVCEADLASLTLRVVLHLKCDVVVRIDAQRFALFREHELHVYNRETGELATHGIPLGWDASVEWDHRVAVIGDSMYFAVDDQLFVFQDECIVSLRTFAQSVMSLLNHQGTLVVECATSIWWFGDLFATAPYAREVFSAYRMIEGDAFGSAHGLLTTLALNGDELVLREKGQNFVFGRWTHGPSLLAMRALPDGRTAGCSLDTLTLFANKRTFCDLELPSLMHKMWVLANGHLLVYCTDHLCLVT